MIQDDEELAIVQRQLALVKSVIESWRTKLLPHNPKNFAIYAEGDLDEAEKLNAEIDEYVQRRNAIVPEATTPQAAPGQQPTKVP